MQSVFSDKTEAVCIMIVDNQQKNRGEGEKVASGNVEMKCMYVPIHFHSVTHICAEVEL